MPNRILREGILTSERVVQLSWPAEVFYRRLHSVVDDFGRYYATPILLRAACYPLQLDKVSDKDIGRWLEEARNTGLIRVFESGGKQYLEVQDFRQQVRATKSKFPQPPPVDAQTLCECAADATQLIADAHLDVVVSGVGVGGRASASRLPADWKLSTDQVTWALKEQPSWDVAHTERIGDAFRDYWLAKAGKDGTKVDWDATWRTWVRKEGARRKPPGNDQFRGVL